jgi:hypothetical protein
MQSDDDAEHFTNVGKRLSTEWNNHVQKLKAEVAVEKEQTNLVSEPVAKKPKVKDKNAPKKGATAYQLFVTQQRDKVKGDLQLQDLAAAADVTFGVVQKELGRLWRLLSKELKQQYEAQSQQDKARYESEMENYQPSLVE